MCFLIYHKTWKIERWHGSYILSFDMIEPM